MTPTQRALSLQHRRDRYRSRRDAALHNSSSLPDASFAPRPGSISSLGAASLASPSLFASTSDSLQPLSQSEVGGVVRVLTMRCFRCLALLFIVDWILTILASASI